MAKAAPLSVKKEIEELRESCAITNTGLRADDPEIRTQRTTGMMNRLKELEAAHPELMTRIR